MWTIARARAAGVLFALAVLLVPLSQASGSPAASGPAALTHTAAAIGAHPEGDHLPEGGASTQRDHSQLALVRQGPAPGVTPERRTDRGGLGLDLTAATAAALAAMVLLGVPVSWRARQRGGRGGCLPRGSRAPPRLLSA